MSTPGELRSNGARSTRSVSTPSLAAVRRIIPARCFECDDRVAARYLVLVVGCLALSEAFTALSWSRGWWPLYPLGWLASGTLFTGLFLITHDCGHHAFFRSERLNQVVGHLASAPLLYPFAQWSAWHDAHHRHTNVLGQTFADQIARGVDLRHDTAFVPARADEPASARRGLVWGLYVLSRRSPPVAVLLIPLLLLGFFEVRGQRRARRYVLSWLVVVLAAVGIGGGLYLGTGRADALLHFWLLPLSVHAGWLGYYAFTQHTGHDVPCHEPEGWRASEAQLLGTVNTAVPRLIQILHSNPDCHVVHHISTAIPSYHMREANDAILASPYAGIIREVPFSPRRFWRLTRECHLYRAALDEYVRFDAGSQSP